MNAQGEAVPIRIVVHVANQEPFVADIAEMPAANATHLVVTNPRTREGRPVAWSSKGAMAFIFPMAQIAYIELLVHPKHLEDVEWPYLPNTKG